MALDRSRTSVSSSLVVGCELVCRSDESSDPHFHSHWPPLIVGRVHYEVRSSRESGLLSGTRPVRRHGPERHRSHPTFESSIHAADNAVAASFQRFGHFMTGSPASGPLLQLCSIVERLVTAPRPKRSGGGADRHLDQAGAIEHRLHAACSTAPCCLFRSGSYVCPPTHSRCNNTDNLRATAIAARFFAFLPPRAAILSPWSRRSHS